LVQNNIVITSNPEKMVDTLLISDIINNPKNLVGIFSELQATKETVGSFVFNSGMYLGAGLSKSKS
jgi:hypothetical protein